MSYKRVKCTTPIYMNLDICKECALKAEKIEDNKEYEQYHPNKTRMNGWQCDMREYSSETGGEVKFGDKFTRNKEVFKVIKCINVAKNNSDLRFLVESIEDIIGTVFTTVYTREIGYDELNSMQKI